MKKTTVTINGIALIHVIEELQAQGVYFLTAEEWCVIIHQLKKTALNDRAMNDLMTGPERPEPAA